MNDQELMNVTEVAERLGMPPRRVRQLVKTGRLKAEATLGRALVFRAREVERFEREANNPYIMSISELAAFYGISYSRADGIFRKKFRALAVGIDYRRGMLYDIRSGVFREIEALHKLKRSREINGEADYTPNERPRATRNR